jgi:hypothetical protein
MYGYDGDGDELDADALDLDAKLVKIRAAIQPSSGLGRRCNK